MSGASAEAVTASTSGPTQQLSSSPMGRTVGSGSF